MNRSLAIAAVAFAGLAPHSSLPIIAGTPAQAAPVVVTEIGRGVYAAIRSEPLGMAVQSNSLFIVGDDGVIVVDAQFTRKATLETLAALRRITTKPVRFVINTHWHDDHVAGNQVYADSFPGVRFLAQRNTRTDLIEKGRPNRDEQLKVAPPGADYFERMLRLGLGGDSTPATPAEMAALTSTVAIIRQYVAEHAAYREVLPDTLFDRAVTLHLRGRTVEVRWFGRANTRGDAVIWLPDEGVVATGDLVVAPIPFTFNSYPTEWITVMDSLAALKPRVLVPGHGPVMRDLNYVQTVQRMLATARQRTLDAVAQGLSADSVRRVVSLADLRTEVAGDEKWMRTMFGMFFRYPVVGRLIEEAKNGPLK